MKNTVRNLLIVLMLLIPNLAHAQENFSVGAAMTSTYAGIGLGIDVGVNERGSSDAARFGLWLNIPSATLQTQNFGVGFKVVLISYNPFDIFAIPLGGYGDFFAIYTGVYGTLGVGGNSGFLLGVGALLGLDLNPIPQVFGLYAEFGLGLGVPYIVDANLTIGARIYVGHLF